MKSMISLSLLIILAFVSIDLSAFGPPVDPTETVCQDFYDQDVEVVSVHCTVTYCEDDVTISYIIAPAGRSLESERLTAHSNRLTPQIERLTPLDYRLCNKVATLTTQLFKYNYLPGYVGWC